MYTALHQPLIWLLTASLGLFSANLQAQQQPAPPAEPAATNSQAQMETPANKPGFKDGRPHGKYDGRPEGRPDGRPDSRADAAPRKQAVLPHDLSPWGMFMQADWVVKSVMIGLLLASLATWTVLVAKSREFRRLMRAQRQALAIVNDAASLQQAHQQLSDQARPKADNAGFTRAAAQELKLSAQAMSDVDGVKERVASRLERLEAASGRRASRGTGLLASIGSTAPFVGLFGTVWGIMNSFIGISKAQTTNLAVVAPGIAEALLATALGLVAAIPAVVIYNHFARQTAGYKALLGDTSAAVLRLVSRDLSHSKSRQRQE